PTSPRAGAGVAVVAAADRAAVVPVAGAATAHRARAASPAVAASVAAVVVAAGRAVSRLLKPYMKTSDRAPA
ncbi:hypothetical protein, partial [Sulfitobacter sp. HI0129]|uniref:hypothetical protein n=1 Tax=Sulfitobacter sp. HI0129 TaxID=1822268 RepID=UPI000A57F4AF